MDDLSGYVSDDELAIEPLRELDIVVETLSWRQTGRDWGEFDAVVIRTPWDYQRSPERFIAVLDEIGSATRLLNPVNIVRWNFDKLYLRELSQKGVRIVPTLFESVYGPDRFAAWSDELACSELIVKPRVSATAENTFRVSEFEPSLVSIFETRPFLVQPFLTSIVDEGEYSLFYFNGELSHAIVKRAKQDDFRVQEEHGGSPSPIEATDAMRQTADAALAAIGVQLLYARVDLIRDRSGEFGIMELELIEPALYLRMESGAPERFARAIEARLGDDD